MRVLRAFVSYVCSIFGIYPDIIMIEQQNAKVNRYFIPFKKSDVFIILSFLTVT